MTWSVDQIWRYPINGIGAEALTKVDLTVGRPFPLDRAWAVLEEGGDRSEGWRSCRNFLRGAKGPSLMAIRARVDGTVIHLTHPDRPEISIDPTVAADADRLFEWITPIYPEERRAPVALVTSPPEGMADADFASISILNHASLRALSQKLGQDLDPRRFRGNIWVNGMALWEEFDLVGKTLNIGGVTLEVVDRITRCRATEANPETGRRDANTLRALEDGWGHQDFGVYAKVRTPGTLQAGDTVTVV